MFVEPRWVPGTPGYGAITLGGEQINVVTAQGTFSPWLTSGGADFESFDVSRDGTLAVFQLTADGSPPQGSLALTVRVTVADRAGNRRIVTRRLTVRR